MSLALASQSMLDSHHKMDNVLYEIRDSRGIPKNNYYEPWKEEILKDLQISGFIAQESNVYVLTEAGREVIKNVSFRIYKKMVTPGKPITADTIQEHKKKGAIKFWFMLLVFVQVSFILFLTLFKF